MFTAVDKAIVAMVMGALYIVNEFFGTEVFNHITEEMVTVVIALLTPFLVYLVPNRP
jgi:aromatic ring hydroxylase